MSDRYISIPLQAQYNKGEWQKMTVGMGAEKFLLSDIEWIVVASTIYFGVLAPQFMI